MDLCFIMFVFHLLMYFFTVSCDVPCLFKRKTFLQTVTCTYNESVDYLWVYNGDQLQADLTTAEPTFFSQTMAVNGTLDGKSWITLSKEELHCRKEKTDQTWTCKTDKSDLQANIDCVEAVRWDWMKPRADDEIMAPINVTFEYGLGKKASISNTKDKPDGVMKRFPSNGQILYRLLETPEFATLTLLLPRNLRVDDTASAAKNTWTWGAFGAGVGVGAFGVSIFFVICYCHKRRSNLARQRTRTPQGWDQGFCVQ